MNLLLIEPREVGPDGWVRLTGRRADHLRRVLGVAPGRELRAGVLGQGIGTARVAAVDSVSVELVVDGIDREADRVASGPPIDLILAVPRPKALRRILRLVAAMGVRRLTLTNAWRVEKSYFASPVLEPEAIERELLLGAEQGATARLPAVTIERLFVPFVERLESQSPRGPRWVAHPGGEAIATEISTRADLPDAVSETLLAIGPEGGWIDDELATFDRAGFRPVSLGPWVLTSEAAVAVAVGQVQVLEK